MIDRYTTGVPDYNLNIIHFPFRKKVINHMHLGTIRIPFILLDERRQKLRADGMKGSPDSYRMYEKTDILRKDI
jgi:hypothetical protein